MRFAMRVSCRNTLRRPVGRLMTISCYRNRTGRGSVRLMTHLRRRTGVGTCAFDYLWRQLSKRKEYFAFDGIFLLLACSRYFYCDDRR